MALVPYHITILPFKEEPTEKSKLEDMSQKYIREPGSDVSK